MSNVPSQRTIQGLKGLATFLTKERSKLQRDTIVLISSEPYNDKKFRPAVDDAVRQVQFLLQQRFAFRVATVQVKTAIFDPSSIKLMQVAQRVRAKTVVAVGSGNAMDVAKWWWQQQQQQQQGNNNINNSRVLYVPATYGAAMVASTPTSLKVNADGEIDVVVVDHDDDPGASVSSSSSAVRHNDNDNVHHVLLEEAHFDVETKNIALSAALAICYDAGLPIIPLTLPSTHQQVYDFVTQTGQNHLSYGLGQGQRPRSKPLAIATALQATLFPNYTLLEIMASLLPAYHPPSHLIPPDIPQFLTAEPWETVLASLLENAATWNCWDEPEEDFKALLFQHHMI